MTAHPYKSLPKEAFWRKSVVDIVTADVDPVRAAKFVLSRSDRIVTAGSCFAQHIARYLSQSGFNYVVTETAHPLIPKHVAEEFNYGLFTARYGNIYTSRQMIQLVERAYNLFEPDDNVWIEEDGSLIDPFRPQIQKRGFDCLQEFQIDRAQHFAAVRVAVETMDCLVLTLGLTECWLSRKDGAAYPVCPGVSGGQFDSSRYNFHNLTVSEVVSDLDKLIIFIRVRNPTARIIFTVSPVPLVATASGDHVLSATTYSKSVLRAAAGEVAARYDNTAYFPSYEIITGSYNRGIYFAPDLRSVTEAGVAHVMRLFLSHYGSEAEKDSGMDQPAQAQGHNLELEDIVKVVCEEEALQQF